MFNVSCSDVFESIASLDDESVHLCLTDPPYFKVVDEPWDAAWDKPGEFLEWMGDWLAAIKPKMSKRGTVVVFTSPAMFGRVEQKVAESFSVFGNVVWEKPTPGRYLATITTARGPLHRSERVVFAERHEGTNDWHNLTDGVRGGVFEPLRLYLDGERQRSGVTIRQVAEEYQKITGSRTVTGMAGHWFGRSQWAMPTAGNYQWLRETLSRLNKGTEYLRRDYEDLRRDYEDLRRRWNSDDYDDWRYLCDVWSFPTVGAGRGRHVCEKPYGLLRHIIDLTTDEDDLVYDPFCGSGSTGEAALLGNRRFTGSDASPKWATKAASRCGWAAGETPHIELPDAVEEPTQLHLMA